MIKASISKRFSNDLIHWYQRHGRFDLPWQKNKTAYRVWVSEIMLQQTQVSTAIPYYQHFMRSFPNLKTLAQAEENQVLTHWSGLGYYARARNLHKTAQLIQHQFKGRFPKTIEELQTLPGIGQSTAGAILSFAYNLPTTICDGNVKRVLARVFAIQQEKQSREAINLFWNIATMLTPKKNTALYNQAIMDVGATLCTRTKPHCSLCPFERYCEAHKQQRETAFPISRKKKTNPVKEIHLLLFENSRGQILLEKRPSQGIWGGLWSLPECELGTDIARWALDQFGLQVLSCEADTPLLHKFSHYTLHIKPLKIKVKPVKKLSHEPACQHWHLKGGTLPGGIPGPIKRYL